MTRKLVTSLFAFALLVPVAVAIADAPEAVTLAPAEPLPLEPLPWLEATGVGYCVGTCNGAAEIIFKCDNLNPEKCCQLLEESGACYSFIGYCSAAWDARCRF